MIKHDQKTKPKIRLSTKIMLTIDERFRRIIPRRTLFVKVTHAQTLFQKTFYHFLIKK